MLFHETKELWPCSRSFNQCHSLPHELKGRARKASARITVWHTAAIPAHTGGVAGILLSQCHLSTEA